MSLLTVTDNRLVILYKVYSVRPADIGQFGNVALRKGKVMLHATDRFATQEALANV